MLTFKMKINTYIYIVICNVLRSNISTIHPTISSVCATNILDSLVHSLWDYKLLIRIRLTDETDPDLVWIPVWMTGVKILIKYNFFLVNSGLDLDSVKVRPNPDNLSPDPLNLRSEPDPDSIFWRVRSGSG